ncbi:integrase [Pseudonocardiaceae bacterium YIM PH 21723]|nr:integrase [Pseudonocardiaceae bacterium YIM PH 21723]
MVSFVWWLAAHSLDPDTIANHVSGAVHHLQAEKVIVDPEHRKLAAAALRKYRNSFGKDPLAGRAHPAMPDDIAAVVEACPETLEGLRDRTMATLGFAIASRASDLANLDVRNVQRVGQGLIVTVTTGKTVGVVDVPYGDHAATCPVRNWDAWIAESGITSGRAFRKIDRNDLIVGKGIGAQAVCEILKRAGVRAGLDFTLTGHSLRSGFATAAFLAGKPRHEIEQQGRWAPGSKALDRYFRRAERWKSNPLLGLGL